MLLIDFSSIVQTIDDSLEKYRRSGFTVEFQSDDSNYEAIINKDDKKAIIRDGMVRGDAWNKKPPKDTSFDVLFITNGTTFLKYMSDYPMDQYPIRITEAFNFIDNFFAENYTITNERYFYFWNKDYMHICVNDEISHLLGVHQENITTR